MPKQKYWKKSLSRKNDARNVDPNHIKNRTNINEDPDLYKTGLLKCSHECYEKPAIKSKENFCCNNANFEINSKCYKFNGETRFDMCGNLGYRSLSMMPLFTDCKLGNFHQADQRFPSYSKGFQCTCNALMFLVQNIFF